MADRIESKFLCGKYNYFLVRKLFFFLISLSMVIQKCCFRWINRCICLWKSSCFTRDREQGKVEIDIKCNAKACSNRTPYSSRSIALWLRTWKMFYVTQLLLMHLLQVHLRPRSQRHYQNWQIQYRIYNSMWINTHVQFVKFFY